jgi:hypothetical protein
MIGVALSALAGLQSASPSPVAASEEIRVLGERLGTWRGRIRDRRGEMRCVTTTSSGDHDVDNIGCDAMIRCFGGHRQQILVLTQSRRPVSERRALQAAVNRDLGACFAHQHDTLIAELADRRYQARSGPQDAQD